MTDWQEPRSRLLSPVQFGFERVSTPLGDAIGNHPDLHQTVTQRELDLSTPLRASQTKMSAKTVEHYVANPDANLKDYQGAPMVVSHRGQNVVWAGHHRIAAARRRGDTTMKVDYQVLR